MDGATERTGGGKPFSRGPIWRVYLSFVAVGMVIAIVNSTSVIDDRAVLGQPVDAWRAWTWELTSYAAWLLLMPLLLNVAARLYDTVGNWLTVLLIHAALTIAFSLGHVGLMVGMRKLIYAFHGDTYGLPGSLEQALVYEYRKDLVTYGAVVLLLLIAQRTQLAAVQKPVDADSATPARRIEVRDGPRTIWLDPDEILWAESAGNYVELHGEFGQILHRYTLTALEQQLSELDFWRIHRSRIVRRSSVRSVLSKPSGDFEVVLDGNVRLQGSRRFKHPTDRGGIPTPS